MFIDVVEKSGKDLLELLLIIEDTTSGKSDDLRQFDKKFISLKTPIVRVRREDRHERYRRCKSECSDYRWVSTGSMSSTLSSFASLRDCNDESMNKGKRRETDSTI
jgi:hypothetical protein